MAKAKTVKELEQEFPELIKEIRAVEAKKVEAELRKKIMAEAQAAPPDPLGPLKKDIRDLIKKHPNISQFNLALRYAEQGQLGLATIAMDNGRKAMKR